VRLILSIDRVFSHNQTCWPVPATSVTELHEIKQTHVACPVPLFDLDGHFVLPGVANITLPGATVFVRFTLVTKKTRVGVITAGLPDYIVLLP
jgi:hypothetical protein